MSPGKSMDKLLSELSADDEKLLDVLNSSFDRIASMLSLLGHPNRLRILIMLLEQDQSFGNLLDETGLKKSGLSSHIQQLKDEDLVESPSHGMYSLTDIGRSYLVTITMMFDVDSGLDAQRQRMQAARRFLERQRG